MRGEFSSRACMVRRYFPLAQKFVSKLYNVAKSPRLLYRTQSSFHAIRVTDRGHLRYLQFGEGKTPIQSCINLKYPDRIMMGCSALMLSSLFLNPNPQSILIIGLGGGILSRSLAKLRPSAKIISVELDPEIVGVSRSYFYFKLNENQKIVIDEGRKYLESALSQKKEFDLIMLDAFGTNYIPSDLMTLACLETVKSLLSANGVLASNTFGSSSYYNLETETYTAAFGKFYQLKYFNRIIIAQKNSLTPFAKVQMNVDRLGDEFKSLDINAKYLGHLFKVVRSPVG